MMTTNLQYWPSRMNKILENKARLISMLSHLVSHENPCISNIVTAISLSILSGYVGSLQFKGDGQPWVQTVQFRQEARSDLLVPEDRRMNRRVG